MQTIDRAAEQLPSHVNETARQPHQPRLSAEYDISIAEFTELGVKDYEQVCGQCQMIRPKAFFANGICGECQ